MPARGTAGTFAGRRPPNNISMRAQFDCMKRAYKCATRLAKKDRVRISQSDFVKDFPVIKQDLEGKNVRPEKLVELTAAAYVKMCIDKRSTQNHLTMAQ